MKYDKGKVERIISDNSIVIQDNKFKIENILKEFEKRIENFNENYSKDFEFVKAELNLLGDPVRQALEKNQREAENMMFELKNVQKESRQAFSEFDKSKAQLVNILDSAKNENLPQQNLQNTVSMVNLDTNILISQNNYNPSETVISTTVRNAPMSPISQARIPTSHSDYSKIKLSRLPILKSRKGYMTSRDLTRKGKSSHNDSDFKSFDGRTIKETEEEERKGSVFIKN